MDPVQTTHINVASACARYSIGKTLLYRLLRDGHIRAVKLGARTLVDVASIDRYFATLPEILPKNGDPLIGRTMQPAATATPARVLGQSPKRSKPNPF